jgi:hypothetical protein
MHPYKAQIQRALRFRYAAMAVGLVWVVFMGWSEFYIPEHEVYFQQQRFNRQLEECRGAKAAQRFDCKSDLLVGAQASKFYDWTERVVIVFAPPLFLIWLVTKLAMPKRPKPGGLFRERPEPPPRKNEDNEF